MIQALHKFFFVYSFLRKHFKFIEDYGWKFKWKLNHYVHPGISFTNGNDTMTIGYDYSVDEDKYYINFIKETNYSRLKDILADTDQSKLKEKQKLDLAKAELRKFLEQYKNP